ncbi:MAG: dephospho-CoA kinase [Xanthomonadales bacterium]|nr:dephospho-CoA kinase [Xanthomonadales bacterium]
MRSEHPKTSAFVIALTGGIASGKTAVSDAFAELGVTVVDTDLIAREVVLPQTVGLAEIIVQFGEQVVDGKGLLNRKYLREIIFSDADKRKRLESILHPLIRVAAIVQLQAVTSKLALLVVPLLAEVSRQNNSYQWVDRILVVDVGPTTQVQRLTTRDHINIKQAKAILASQVGRQQRNSLADDIISNENSRVSLVTEVKKLHNKYLKLAAAKTARALS